MSNIDVIDEYIEFYVHSKQSQKTRKSALNYFFEKYGFEKDIFQITTKDLLNYFTWLKGLKDINLTTKRNKWALFSSFLNFLMEDPENDFLVKIPSRRINWNGTSNKTNNSNKDVYATKEELKLILDYFKVRNMKQWLIFKLFVHTGMRKGELINLRIDEVNIQDRIIHLYIGKTMEKYYILPNEPRFLSMFKMYYAERQQKEVDNDYLFLTNRENHYGIRRFNVLLEEARKHQNITNKITCHSFRRTLNDFRKEMDCSLEDRELLLGHKTQNVNISGYTKSDIMRHRYLADTWNPYKEDNF